MKIRLFAIACALVLNACSGSGGALSPATSTHGTSTSTSPGSTAPAAAKLVPTNFTFVLPKTATSSARRPQYVTANIQSVTITLNTVNGAAPPSGLTTSVTTNMTTSSCPCSVPGPPVPPGTDNFTLTTFDAQNAGGAVVSVGSPTYVIAVGVANLNTVTLDGVPASVTFPTVTAAAGTTLSSAFNVTVNDADGNAILGTYANPVSLSASSGAVSISTSGSDSPAAGQLLSSSDSASIAYSGLAIVPATFTATAGGTTIGTGTFTPALQAIAYAGPTVSGSPEIDLYATSGAGSSATFSASEAGWSNSPYSHAFTATLGSGCSAFAGVSPSSGTSFTISAIASPAAGTCNLTLSDGVGQSKSVELTYTTSGIGVQ